MAAALTPRERQLLDALGTIRVATTDQLADIVFDAEEAATAYRLARRHLTRLQHFGLAQRFPNTAPPRRPGPAGYIYSLTAAGLTIAGRTASRQRRSWQPSPTKLAHWLAISQLYARLMTNARQDGPTVADFRVEGDAMRRYRDRSGHLAELRPDARLRLLTPRYELLWFIEMDLATEASPALTRKCRSYRAYEQTGIEQELCGLFPGVIFIVPSVARADAVQRVINRQPADARGLFFVTTEAEAPQALATVQ